MKKLTVADLLKKSIKDLVALRNKIRRELFDNKLRHRMNALWQTHLLKLWRRNIARINATISALVSQKS